MNHTNSSDLTRTTLAVLFIGILIAACFWVMRPFLSSLLWAAMIVIATWPNFLKLQTRLRGKRWLAVLVMTVVLLLVLILPICFAVLTILDRSDQIVGWFKSLSTVKIPPPPGWIEKIPVVGHSAVERWQQFAAVSPEELSKMTAPYATKLVAWFVAQAGNFSLLVLHFLLSIAIAAVLYAKGEATASGIRLFARRLAGQAGDEVAVLSAKAVRGVALGIVVTALVQSSLGGVGLFFAGVPGAVLLTAVMLMLCIAQIGPALVVIPADIWLFYNGHTLAGSLFAIWAVFVLTIDNFLRPILIRKGVDLPLLLIITGVIGGLIGFGVIGLFIGPVILAVTFTLLRAWVTGVAGVTAPIAPESPKPAAEK
jgi:predicted PurR-regulated permease PerM